MWRNSIAKTTFASANQKRDYRFLQTSHSFMMEQARKKQTTDILSWKGMCMSLTLRQYFYICQSFDIPSFARRKVVLKLMCCMTWKQKFQHTSTSLQYLYTIQKPWSIFLMNQDLAMCLIGVTMPSKNSIGYLCTSLSLWWEPKRIYSLNVSDGNADYKKYTWRFSDRTYWHNHSVEVYWAVELSEVQRRKSRCRVHLSYQCLSSYFTWNCWAI